MKSPPCFWHALLFSTSPRHVNLTKLDFDEDHSADGLFIIALDKLVPDIVNYIQGCNDLTLGDWQTVGTIVSSRSNMLLIDFVDGTPALRFYRLSLTP